MKLAKRISALLFVLILTLAMVTTAAATNAGDNSLVIVLVARSADKDNETYQKILEAYQTQFVAEFLSVYYKGSIIPGFAFD